MDDHENEGVWKVVSQVFWASAEGDEMTKDDILSMAKKAGFDCGPDDCVYNPDTLDGKALDKYLERFAALVAEKEREECAKVCEGHKIDGQLVHSNAAVGCAAAIRARGNK
jgi:hypothetical protein